MYPPHTSLIPAAVALTRYIAEHGFSGNYPYWYLGTTPVRYLTGPVVPNILIVLKNLFSFPNYFVALSSKALNWAKKTNPFIKVVYISN